MSGQEIRSEDAVSTQPASEPKSEHKAEPKGEQKIENQGNPAPHGSSEASPSFNPVPSADLDPVAELTAKLADADAKAQENYDNFLRAKADMENLRRRAQEDVAKAHKFGIENFAENLLPVFDSLYAALADQTGDTAKLREGVELTLRQLKSAFEKGKLIEIDPVGQKFDPHRHQAISMQPSESIAPNHVITVLQKGWMISDRVLRPALVTVAQGA